MAVLSVGMVITDSIHQYFLKIPASAWTPAVEADGTVREGAGVAEVRGRGKLLDGLPGPTTAPPDPGQRNPASPPDATAGPPACPPPAPESEKVRRLRRRTLTQDGG